MLDNPNPLCPADSGAARSRHSLRRQSIVEVGNADDTDDTKPQGREKEKAVARWKEAAGVVVGVVWCGLTIWRIATEHRVWAREVTAVLTSLVIIVESFVRLRRLGSGLRFTYPTLAVLLCLRDWSRPTDIETWPALLIPATYGNHRDIIFRISFAFSVCYVMLRSIDDLAALNMRDFGGLRGTYNANDLDVKIEDVLEVVLVRGGVMWVVVQKVFYPMENDSRLVQKVIDNVTKLNLIDARMLLSDAKPSDKEVWSPLRTLVSWCSDVKGYLPQALLIGSESGQYGTSLEASDVTDWRSSRDAKMSLTALNILKNYKFQMDDSTGSEAASDEPGSSPTNTGPPRRVPTGGSWTETKRERSFKVQSNSSRSLLHQKEYRKVKSVCAWIQAETNHTLPLTTLQAQFECFASVSTAAITLHKGTVEKLYPDTIVASWGVWGFTSSAPQLATAACLTVEKGYEAKISLPTSSAVAMGEIISGQLGSAEMFTSTFISGVPPVTVRRMSHLSESLKLGTVCDLTMMRATQYDFAHRLVDVIAGVTPSAAGQPVYQVIQAIGGAGKNEEWMYVVNGLNGKEYAAFNLGFKGLREGKYHEAKTAFEEHLETYPDDRIAVRWAAVVREALKENDEDAPQQLLHAAARALNPRGSLLVNISTSVGHTSAASLSLPVPYVRHVTTGFVVFPGEEAFEADVDKVADVK